MIVRKILGRVLPRHQTILEKPPRLQKMVKAVARRCEQRTNDVVELYHSGGVTGIEERREALAKYLTSAKKTVELGSVPTHFALMTTPVDKIIAECGDDLAKIEKLTGMYGLAKYAKLPAHKIISKSKDIKIKETGYLSETVEGSFRNYLMINDKGYVKDFYERFGECGKILRDVFQNMSFLRFGNSADGAETYTITPFFKDMANMFDNVELMGY